MKKATAWLLLTTYLCASCAGLLPLAGDVVAHVFWHEQHIKHVHHGKKGQAHVAVEMARLLSADQDQPVTFSESSGGKLTLSAHDLPIAVLGICALTSRSFVAFPNLDFRLPARTAPPVFLPPKLS